MKKIDWSQHYYYNLKHHVVNRKRLDKDGPASGLVSSTWALIGVTIITLLKEYERCKIIFLFIFFAVLIYLYLNTYAKRNEIELHYESVPDSKKKMYKNASIFFLVSTIVVVVAMVWLNRPGK